MNENKNIHKFLSDQMSVDKMDLQEPEPYLVMAAREKIQARKKRNNEIEDLFSMVAAFLNFKIKLYHAVIAAIIISGIILFTSRDEKSDKTDSHTNAYVSNIASVRSSTVLSSIYTFGLNRKQYDGRANN